MKNFKKENEDKKILAVAICYDSKEKEHNCKIEEIIKSCKDSIYHDGTYGDIIPFENHNFPI
jgi:hypothetical protein